MLVCAIAFSLVARSSISPTQDSVPGFAPSVGSMLGNFGESYEKAATAYCGLEASFETTDGKTALLVIADGFDDAWVLSPGL